MNYKKEPTIGALVAADYRVAAVFQKHDIDFCCNGNRSITDACGGDTDKIEAVKDGVREMGELTRRRPAAAIDYNSWPADLLADYIEKKHHRYVREHIPILKAYLEKICEVHGNCHPELFEIKSLFTGCAAELSAHMQKEESELFPFIRRMIQDPMPAPAIMPSPFGSVRNPIRRMIREHDAEGLRFRQIASLSGNYTAPADACNTYRVTYSLLHAFEQDLLIHIHLENNILFPKAAALETALGI